jgi:hypothetical protein
MLKCFGTQACLRRPKCLLWHAGMPSHAEMLRHAGVLIDYFSLVATKLLARIWFDRLTNMVRHGSTGSPTRLTNLLRHGSTGSLTRLSNKLKRQ